jgi:hypothetical protein
MPFPDDFDCARYDATIGGVRNPRAEELAAKNLAINEAIRAIILRAADEIEAMDLTGYSMASGYDLDQMPDLLREIVPLTGKEDIMLLDDWADGQVE